MSKYYKVVFALLIILLISLSAGGFICGDANNDGLVNILDITFMIAYLYDNGPEPDPIDAADVNNNGAVNIIDITDMISYLYFEGPPPDCPPQSVDSVILPLDIGNQWLTNVVEYNSSGQIVSEYVGTGTVVGDTLIDDWIWSFMFTDTGGGDTSLWTNKEDGAWLWTDSAGEPSALMLKYPATAGQSYPLYDVTVAVESINANVSVPAGDFECYYYNVTIPIYGSIGKIWAAPNIGLVRAEEYGLTLFGTYLSKTIELDSYELIE